VGRIQWKLTLEAGKTVDLAYAWHYFWRYGRPTLDENVSFLLTRSGFRVYLDKYVALPERLGFGNDKSSPACLSAAAPTPAH